MRLPIALGVASATVLACQNPPEEPAPAAPLIDLVVRVDRSATKTRLALDSGTPTLFLNRCRGGCTLTPGPDDSRIDQSSLVPPDATLPEYQPKDHFWSEVVRCVKQKFDPFEIEITDVDPSPSPHFETIVAGRPSDLGLSNEIGGVSPLACGVIDNGVNFAFAEAHDQTDPEGLCTTIAHEVGHTLGLEHAYDCHDVMTYKGACGDKGFFRADTRCGGFFEEPCTCYGERQNSYLTLLDAFGPRRTPQTWSPRVEIEVPRDGAVVEPGFRIWADASDDDGDVAHVAVSIDGVSLGEATLAPYGFRAPADLAFGTHEIVAVATDADGLISRSTISVDVAPSAARRVP